MIKTLDNAECVRAVLNDSDRNEMWFFSIDEQRVVVRH